eukprot:6462749-Amphidinium_carterae.3
MALQLFQCRRTQETTRCGCKPAVMFSNSHFSESPWLAGFVATLRISKGTDIRRDMMSEGMMKMTGGLNIGAPSLLPKMSVLMRHVRMGNDESLAEFVCKSSRTDLL